MVSVSMKQVLDSQSQEVLRPSIDCMTCPITYHVNDVTINPMCDCMTDGMSDPTDNTMTDQNCDIRAVLQSCNVLCVCSKPLHDEMKSHTGCIWLIKRIFSIHDVF